MSRVREVMSASSRVSSRFRVSGRMSQKTGRAPRWTKALAVETKVKAGTITSSPGREIEERAGHLQGMRAGGCDERAPNAERFLEKLVALPGKKLVARDLAHADRLENVFQFASFERRTIEGEVQFAHAVLQMYCAASGPVLQSRSTMLTCG